MASNKSLLLLTLTLLTTSVHSQLFGPDVDLDRARFSLSYLDEDAELGYRLPNDTIPVHYDINLITNIHLEDEQDPAKFRLDGEVRITIEVIQETDVLVLHSRNLTIKDALLKDSQGATIQTWASADEIPFDDHVEFNIFNLDTPLTEGDTYTIEVRYFGAIRDDLYGFYRAAYIDENGKTKWFAMTQFESTSAREAFPCYDEPGLRATMKLSITHGATYFAVANMPVESRRDEGNGIRTSVFKSTPPMQTYLLAFVVSDYSFIEAHTDVPQRVYARPAIVKNGDGDYALRAGVKILNYLDEVVHLSYGKNNPKMDQIGIPDRYFDAGAMENWGLVTYLEGALYYNEKTDRTDRKRGTAGIIAHEYAHQYFGNLVSPKWWSYLWLNEGFATLYGSWLAGDTYPETSANDLYITGNYQAALAADALGYTRPMTLYVETPRAISNLFDGIAYGKASTVLRMLSMIMTNDVWRKGLNLYLTEMENKAADSDDLARGLQKAVDEAGLEIGATIKEIIDSWSLNAGVPVLHVAYNADLNQLQFTQERFLASDNTNVTFTNKNENWMIPVTIISTSQPVLKTTVPQFWVKEKTLDKEPNERLKWTANDWVLVNVDAAGYYRVHYVEGLLDRLIQKLDSDSFEDIPVYSRTQLIDDAFAFGRADKLDYVSIFKLTRYLSRERHFLPWVTASNGFTYLRNLLADSSSADSFSRFVRELVEPLYNHVGIHDLGNTETNGEKRAREVAINWACRTGVESCLTEARARLESALTKPDSPVEVNLQGVLECAAIRQVSNVDFNRVWTRMQQTQNPSERSRLVSALGCTQITDQQELYLKTTLMAAPIYTPTERNTILRSIYMNERNGLHNSIEFLLKNYRVAKPLYPSGAIKSAITNMATYVGSEDTLERYSELLTKGEAEGDFNDQEITRLKDIANLNLKWLETNEAEIREYFTSVFGGVSAPVVSSLLVFVFASFSLCFI